MALGDDVEPAGDGAEAKGGLEAPASEGYAPEVQAVGVGRPVGARKAPEPRGTPPVVLGGERPPVLLPPTRGP